MRRRSILIELTSLLDVVLILLFAILVGVKGQADTVQAEADHAKAALVDTQAALADTADALRDTEARLAEAEEQLSAYDRQEITLGVLQENCLVVTVSMDETRCILVESEGKTERIPVSWTDAYAYNALRASLNRYAGAEKQAVFFIFQYDRTAIYETDYQLISNAISAQKIRDNVYTAEYDVIQGG